MLQPNNPAAGTEDPPLDDVALLGPADIDFLRGFGYVVVDAPEGLDLNRLHAESARAMEHAYPEELDGTLLLPAMSHQTPFSYQLVHDPRILRSIQTVIGGAPILKPPKITSFGQPTNWHRDSYLKISGIKIAIYFGEEDVPFLVVPGSHTGPARHYLDRVFNCEQVDPSAPRNPGRVLPEKIPFETLILMPRQILLFDLGLWHANLSSTRRLQWAATYLAEPRDEEGRRALAEHLCEFFEYRRSYPRELFPYFPEAWLRGNSDSVLCHTLRSSGVLDLVAERQHLLAATSERQSQQTR